MEIDKQYSTLLNIGINNPKFRDCEFTKNYAKLNTSDHELYVKYCTYAYMIWSYMETIYDMSIIKNRFSYINKIWFLNMIEEIKLHFTWFKDNPHLFRKKFKEYIQRISIIKLSKGSDADFTAILDQYEKDFPEVERKSKKQLSYLFNEYQNYELFIARHNNLDINSEIIGYAFTYEMRDIKFCILDYLAIMPKFRSCGFGTEFIEKLIELNGKFSMVFKIDSNNAISENTVRRNKFLQRLGARQITVDYIPSENGKEKMEVMIISSDKKGIILGDDIKASLQSAFRTIHSDYSNTDDVINGHTKY